MCLKQSLAKKVLSKKYRHKQKRASKMSFLESEPDFYNFAINSASNFVSIFSESKSESDDSESDFNLVFINLDICIFFALYLHSFK